VTKPDNYLRRSQLYRRHIAAGATFEACGNSAIVAEYSERGVELEQACNLALADLSTLPRVGFKGVGAPEWLREHGAQLPDSPNFAERQKDGSVLARLSTEESLVLGVADGSALVTTLRNSWSLESATRVYSLPRSDSHCWLALTGNHAAATLAKICAVDLRTAEFADGRIAQTSLAGVGAVVLRNDLSTTPCFFILSDVSATEYLWDALLDAMAEFSGGVVGLAVIRAMLAEPLQR